MKSIPGVTKPPKKIPKNNVHLPDNLYQQVFDNSLLAKIIYIVSDSRIISVNQAAWKLLGYSKKELLTKHMKDIFSISQDSYKKMLKQMNLDGSAKANLSLKKINGKLVPCEITSVIFKNKDGISNVIVGITDLRQRLLKQDKIDAKNKKIVDDNIIIAQTKSDNRHAENNTWIKSISKTSYDVTWDWDIINDLITFGNSYEKVFGYKLPKNKISFKEWMDFFQPDERCIWEMKINKVFESKIKRWEDTCQFTSPDGLLSQVIIRSIIIQDNDGKVIRMIGVIHDISKLKQLEEIHEQEIRIKQKEIIEAIVKAKEMERSDLGKELHDNINQLLGASMLYLDMARNDLQNDDIYLIHSSEYTALAIEEIRKLTKELTAPAITDFDLCEAIESTCHDIMETCPVQIDYILDDCLEDSINEKFKLNTFRILQEQLNNIVKHAKASNVHITLSKTDTGIMLSIADDGVGFDTTQKAKGIGITNIISRSELYKGNANFISEPGKGCLLAITFPAEYAT
jgi:PAS domain S-box-containing protein